MPCPLGAEIVLAARQRFFHAYSPLKIDIYFSYRFPPFFDDNPFGIYQKILAGKIDFPRHLDFSVK